MYKPFSCTTPKIARVEPAGASIAACVASASAK
jgi:hypothetical protein